MRIHVKHRLQSFAPASFRRLEEGKSGTDATAAATGDAAADPVFFPGSTGGAAACGGTGAGSGVGSAVGMGFQHTDSTTGALAVAVFARGGVAMAAGGHTGFFGSAETVTAPVSASRDCKAASWAASSADCATPSFAPMRHTIDASVGFWRAKSASPEDMSNQVWHRGND